MRRNFEQAMKVFQDINMNAALLEKLKQELVGLKSKYAESQMELANVAYPLHRPKMKAADSRSRVKSR